MKNNLKKCLALLLSVVMVLAMTVTVFATEGGNESTPTYSITINASQDGHGVPTANTYKAYKVASFDVTGDKQTITGVEETFSSVSELATIPAFEAWLQNSNKDAAALARRLAAVVTETTAGTESENGVITLLEGGYYLVVETEHSASDASIQTQYILVAVDGEETVNLKTSKPSVEKKIVLESGNNVDNASAAGSLVDDDVVAIGDTVTYRLKAQIPSYSDDVKTETLKFILTDTLSNGLTFSAVSSVVIATADDSISAGSDITDDVIAGSPYTYTAPTSAGGTLAIGLSPATIKNNGGKFVYVTFTATLNNNAVTGSNGNPNSVDLTYTNTWDVNGNGETETTPEDTVITYTGELEIEKVDGHDTATKLPGVKFKITTADTSEADLYFVPVTKEIDNPDEEAKTETPKITVVEYYKYTSDATVGGATTELVTDSNGKIKVVGLNKGSYKAVETATIGDYTLDETPKNLVLNVAPADSEKLPQLENKDNLITESTQKGGSAANADIKAAYTVNWTVNTQNTNTLQIENTKGLTLPGTGGIGTTLFTFGGLALVILAAVLFIVYTKKQRKQA